MHFDDTVYPYLSPPLLDRSLRVRALVDHATDDLISVAHIEAIAQYSPRFAKDKSKGAQPILSNPADDPQY